MAKSPLGYAPFEGFSKGDEGGSFSNAAPSGGSSAPMSRSQATGAGSSAPNAASKNGNGKNGNGKNDDGKNGNGKNDDAAKTAQKGGRRRRRRTRRRSKTRGGSHRRGHRGRHTRRKRRPMPDKGWAKLAPFGRARTVMLRNCGKKCFLGPKKSFPICAKGTCRRNRKGIEAAYVRARQWGKKRSSYKSKGKYITYHGKKGTRRTWMKGSRPRHRRSTYQRVARRAKALLRHRRRR